MKLPFVSRLRLEMAQQEAEHLKGRIADLTTANATLAKMYDEEKEARRQAEAKAVPEPEDSASRHRLFGTDVTRMATEAMRKKGIRDGKLKR